VSGWLGR